MEVDLMWARLLAGVHGIAARREVADLVSGIRTVSDSLPFVPDRLTALTQGAEVLGKVGCDRKKVLLSWQAVELSKQFGFPDPRAVTAARRALEPSIVGRQAHYSPWTIVRTGCLEASLGLAIYSKHHASVWDAAAALLRDHATNLSPRRMQSLLDNLVAAASQMSVREKARPGPGPPPLLRLLGPRVLPPGLKPVRFRRLQPVRPSDEAPGPFLYDPFAAKRAERSRQSQHDAAAATPVQWACGEVAVVDVEVSNPTSVGIKIERLVLEAEHIPAPGSLPPPPACFRPKPVSLNIPAYTKPVRIQLEGVPLAPGAFHLKGCRLTAFGGVSWVQPWLNEGELAVVAEVRRDVVTVTAALPRIQATLRSLDEGSGRFQARSTQSGLNLQGPPSPQRPPTLHLLHGMPRVTTLLLTNTGSVPITEATVYSTLSTGTSDGTSNGMAVTNTTPTNGGGGTMHTRPLLPGAMAVAQVDEAGLAAALPLQPGDEAEVELTWSVTSAGGQPGHSEVVVAHDIVIEYVGVGTRDDTAGGRNSGDTTQPSVKADPAVEAAQGQLGGAERMGRRATIPVTVLPQPSLHVAQIQFREVYVPCSPTAISEGGTEDSGDGLQPSLVGKGVGGDTVAERVCVMQLVVANRGPLPLRAWVGDSRERVEGGGSWIAPGRRGCLAIVLPRGGVGKRAEPVNDSTPPSGSGTLNTSGQGMSRVPSAWSLTATDAVSVGDGPSARAGAAARARNQTPEEQSRFDVAQDIAARYHICFAVDHAQEGEGGEELSEGTEVDIGRLPLSASDIFPWVPHRMLGLLRPPSLTATLTLRPVVPLPHQEGGLLLTSPPTAPDQAAVSGGAYPALHAGVGQLLEVTLCVDRHAPHADDGNPTQVEVSLTCCALHPTGEYRVGSPPTDSDGQTALSGLDLASLPPPDAVTDAGSLAAWNGVHQGLQLVFKPGENRIEHRAAVCLVRAGLYKVDVAEEVGDGSILKKGVVMDVEPCFVLIS